MDKDERFFKEKMGEMLKSIEDGKEGVADELGENDTKKRTKTVSYTHLTLPTN